MNGHNVFSLEPGALVGMSVPAVMRLSLACSNKTDDEVAAAMGWSKSIAARVFSNGDYWPTLPNIPRYCSVVGNTIVAQWVLENAESIIEQVDPMDAPALLKDVRRLMKELSDVLEESEKALEDNHVSPAEARRVARQLEDVFTVGTAMFARLHALIVKNREARP